MNGMISVLLIAISLASTTSGQASKDVSPFVMISNEPISHTNLTSTDNDTASSIQNDLIQTLSQCEPQQYILLSQFGLQPEDIQNASMPKLHRLIQNAARAVVIPQVSDVVDCMSIAASALRGRCIGTQQLYYDARLESIEEFCDCESCVPWSHDAEREGMLVRVPYLPHLPDLHGDEEEGEDEERSEVLRRTAGGAVIRLGIYRLD
ncbi:hypothetical protein BTJ68_13462 [Hortaea werneckii EXF-2000]|uniref:Protein BIG1 n=1 Tax=Hortaea werneckii EXF-2000 TaxID=1157616 RepID=A0A1Z5SW53_HORWE|nr:hypothetical protein BTJ68_13462 [Hortaea werneckii EXF-2000]